MWASDGGKDGGFVTGDTQGVGENGVDGGACNTEKSSDGVPDTEESGDGVSVCFVEELDVQPARLNKIATAVTVTRHH